MQFLGLGKRQQIKGSTVVGITESGKREVEKYTSGGNDFAVLAALDEKPQLRVSQLVEETHLTFSDVVQRVNRLSKQGYVRLVGMDRD